MKYIIIKFKIYTIYTSNTCDKLSIRYHIIKNILYFYFILKMIPYTFRNTPIPISTDSLPTFCNVSLECLDQILNALFKSDFTHLMFAFSKLFHNLRTNKHHCYRLLLLFVISTVYIA